MNEILKKEIKTLLTRYGQFLSCNFFCSFFVSKKLIFLRSFKTFFFHNIITIIFLFFIIKI
jgi:hypothetical protein